MAHEKFSYRDIGDLRAKTEEIGGWLPLSEDVRILAQEYELCGRKLGNRIVYQPMEGCDAADDGSPGELTLRRYERIARGGPGLVWFEAAAVVPEGRAQKRQMHINRGNLDNFKKAVEGIKEGCLAGNGFEPVVILQATHSGRYSRPNGLPEPVIAYNNPLFEMDAPIDKSHIISDSGLKELEGIYADAARLAEEAGFDGVDVKACHRYLICELLSAFTREGDYGGSFDNRIRFLTNSIKAAQAATGKNFIVTTRMNIYDGFPYPYGFGVSGNGGTEPDMSEPVKLAGILHKDLGVETVNLVMGNPYVNPHVSRPFDNGTYVPDEHPLTGVSRMMRGIAEIQRAHPGLKVIASGFSYLRQFAPHLAAGMLEQGYAGLAGFGRESLADPGFARDITAEGRVDARRVCLTCGQCALRLRYGMETGCVLRDDQYKPVRQ